MACTHQYTWDFIRNNEKYNYLTPEDYKSGKNMTGYPDHAILSAIAYIIEPIESDKSKSI